MRLMASNNLSPIGLDLGGHSVKAVQLALGSRGGPRVAATACVPRENPGAAVTARESRRILDVLRRRGFVGDEVVMACPPDKLLTMTMEFPAKATAAVLDAAARNEFVRSHKLDAKAMQMTYWSLPAPARAAKTVNVTAVACPHSDADALIDTVEAGGLQVVGLDVRAHALARACLPAAADANGVVMILDLGWSAVTLQAVHHGVIVYERTTVEGGLRSLELSLNDTVRLEPEAARHFLFQTGLADARDAVATDDIAADVTAAIVAHFDLVAHEVIASMAYTAQQYPDAPVGRVLLVGGGSRIPGIDGHLERVLGAQCRAATPLSAASAGAALAADCTPMLTAATGLAMFDDL